MSQTIPPLVLFGRGQGSGYVVESETAMDPFYSKEPVSIIGKRIEPGDETDIGGFFCRPIKYLGILNSSDKKSMLFYLGSDNNLFPKHYFGLVCRITETRLFELFGQGSGRDFNYVKGRWK